MHETPTNQSSSVNFHRCCSNSGICAILFLVATSPVLLYAAQRPQPVRLASGVEELRFLPADARLVIDSARIQLGRWGSNRGTILLAQAQTPAPGLAPTPVEPTPAPLASFPKPFGPIKYYKPEAAAVMQAAITLAEDNPQNHYDVVVTAEGNALTDVKVFESKFREELGIKRGDEVGVWFPKVTGKAIGNFAGNIIMGLCTARLILPATFVVGVAAAIYAPPLAPAAPWVAAGVTLSLCYGASMLTSAGLTVIGEEGLKQYSLLRMKTAVYPGDPSTFNPVVPQSLPAPKPYEDYTDQERIYRQYRDRVDYLKQLHETRVTAYPGLTASQVAQRKQFQKDTSERSNAAFELRQEYRQIVKNWIDENTKSLEDQQRKNEALDKSRKEVVQGAIARNVEISEGTARAAQVIASLDQQIDSYAQGLTASRQEGMLSTLDARRTSGSALTPSGSGATPNVDGSSQTPTVYERWTNTRTSTGRAEIKFEQWIFYDPPPSGNAVPIAAPTRRTR